jgi:hypothetical protein
MRFDMYAVRLVGCVVADWVGGESNFKHSYNIPLLR